MRKNGFGNDRIFIKTDSTRTLELIASHFHFHMAFKVYHYEVLLKKEEKKIA